MFAPTGVPQDVYDSTGNIRLDYTLSGFDKTVEPDSE
jgi:hypothetical protein